MRAIFLLILCCSVLSCAKPPIKDHVKDKPEFTSKIDNKEVQTIVDEFLRLSKRNNITFNKNVTIGFSNINRGYVIGTCTYQESFREIDLDKGFWDRASWNEKVALVYHELAHCYCSRGHDFSKSDKYEENILKSFLSDIFSKPPFSLTKQSGYFEDNCPLSLMHPTIVEEDCLKEHYQHYANEMFERCDPW